MSVNPSRPPRADQYYTQAWGQEIVDRLSDVIAYLSGQIEIDIPLIGLSGRRKKITRITAATATVTPADHIVLVNFAGAVTLTLADGAGDGQELVIIDTSGQAAINPITIIPAVGEINGNPSIALNSRFEQVTIIYDAETPMWLADKIVGAEIAPPAGSLTLTTTAPSVVEV